MRANSGNTKLARAKFVLFGRFRDSEGLFFAVSTGPKTAQQPFSRRDRLTLQSVPSDTGPQRSVLRKHSAARLICRRSSGPAEVRATGIDAESAREVGKPYASPSKPQHERLLKSA